MGSLSEPLPFPPWDPLSVCPHHFDGNQCTAEVCFVFMFRLLIFALYSVTSRHDMRLWNTYQNYLKQFILIALE